MANRSDHTFDLGETWVIQITCHDDPDGVTAMDLTGGSVALAMGDLTVAAVLTDAANGVATISVTPAEQAGLSAGLYTYTIRVTRDDASVSDQAYGLITVRGTEFPAP